MSDEPREPKMVADQHGNLWQDERPSPGARVDTFAHKDKRPRYHTGPWLRLRDKAGNFLR